MPQSLKDILGSTLEAGDRRCTLREAFFNIDDGILRYVALDIGGWLNVDEVLVQANYLRAPEQEGGAWHIALGDSELKHAPAWNDGNRRDITDMTSWPPVIVGPFGNAFAPMLIHEQMRDMETGAEEAEPGRGTADRLVTRLQKVGAWIGLPVFSDHGEEGEVLDILVDPDSLQIVALEVGESSLLSSTGRKVPYGAVRHVAEQGTHLVVAPDTGG
ncbi:MAG TPA: hypothetical protein DEA05_12085 [Rhodobacteraceae bacterium]|jgi:hypothetical protein|nr:hypothetical protein [Paracoccaceae bacterium]